MGRTDIMRMAKFTMRITSLLRFLSSRMHTKGSHFASTAALSAFSQDDIAGNLALSALS